MTHDDSTGHAQDYALDYQALGFKAGLEIHQQLAGKKLFCDCPCEIRKDEPAFTVTRRLRARAGESGGLDQAALHEQRKEKRFVYQGYDTTCLVELDEEPPHPVNQDALKACLRVCKLLNMNVERQAQFMRKVVIDGSNTTGFQRTALIGRDGWIDVGGKRISVQTVCLEEEACQAVSREKDTDTYNLSRLGIPLIEIATGPDITMPEEAKEAASKLGMILRSVEGMKRGIGTIRQDVNVSITAGSRVEIKGFQEYKSIPKVIEYEVGRQLEIINGGGKVAMEVRAAKEDFTTEFLRPMPGADRMYPETDIPIIEIDYDVEAVKTLDEQEHEIIEKHKISPALVKELLRRKIDLDEFTEKHPRVPASFIAETLINTPKDIKARYKLDVDVLECIDPILTRLEQEEIPAGAVPEILKEIAEGKKVDYTKYAMMPDDELDRIITEIVKANPDLSVQGLMGLAMGKLRGKADGKRIMEKVKAKVG